MCWMSFKLYWNYPCKYPEPLRSPVKSGRVGRVVGSVEEASSWLFFFFPVFLFCPCPWAASLAAKKEKKRPELIIFLFPSFFVSLLRPNIFINCLLLLFWRAGWLPRDKSKQIINRDELEKPTGAIHHGKQTFIFPFNLHTDLMRRKD